MDVGEPVRWLSASEQQAWRAFLEAGQLVFDGLERQLQRDAGISHADYEILARLSEAPDQRMRMSELAERALFSRSRLSHAVVRLEGVGLVQRETCPTDRRGTLAVLTSRGREALEAAAPGHVAAVRRLVFDRLQPSQVAQLDRISTVLRRTARAERERPEPQPRPA